MRTFTVAALTLTAVALFVAPTASAHTAIYSADNKVRGSVGLLNEPVSVDALTGLDICFTQNVATSPRPNVDVGSPGALTAVLHAPTGATLEKALKVQTGKPNCVTFTDPFVVTQPGQYTVDLSGAINGTTISVTAVAAGGAVRPRSDFTFPDSNLQSSAQLQARVSALETKIADLEKRPAPTASAPLAMAGLVGLAALLRRAA